MGGENQRGLLGCQSGQGLLWTEPLDTLLNLGQGRVPQPSTVQEGLRQQHKMLARQGAPFWLGFIGETQSQVDVHDMPASACELKQN